MEKEDDADGAAPPAGGGGSAKDGVREVAAAPGRIDMFAMDEFMLPPNPEPEGVKAAEPQGFDGVVAEDQLTDVAGGCCCCCC